MTTDREDIPAPQQIPAAEYRRVLGHYPTGVAVITSSEGDGTPIGMVVGTFTSVSLDPPLVGFLADHASSTWPRIRTTGRFCVNVLSCRQEHVCRAFVTKDPQRFEDRIEDAGSASPRLAGAAAWVDCDLESVVVAGDHDFAIGRVRGLGVGADRSLPLVFVRGGFGEPRLISSQTEQPVLGPRLRLADRVRREAEALSRELHFECLVSAPVDGHVVILAAAGIDTAPGGSTAYVGATFPLAAPFGPHLVAWAGPDEEQRWLAAGRRLTGADVTAAAAAVASIREHGYHATTGRSGAEQFRQAVFGEAGDYQQLNANAQLMADDSTAGHSGAPGRDPLEDLPEVMSLHAPVRDAAGGVVLSLDVIGFSGDESIDERRLCRDRLLAGARRASELLGFRGAT